MISTNKDKDKLVITMTTACPGAHAENIPKAILDLLQNQDETQRTNYSVTVYYASELIKCFIPNEQQWDELLRLDYTKPTK